LRILLTNHFPYHGSGTGTYVRDLARLLTIKKHEVQAVIVDRVPPAIHGGSDEKVDSDPCPTTRILCGAERSDAALDFDFPCFTAHPQSWNTFTELSDSQIEAYVKANRVAITAAVKKFAPDVIHCQHLWIQASIVRELSIPYIISAQGTDLMSSGAGPRLLRLAEDAAAGAQVIVAASKFIERQVLARVTVEPAKIRTILSAIDLSAYDQRLDSPEKILSRLGLPADLRPIVLFLGKFVDFKGIDLLLDAARIYNASPKGISTVFCGDGPLLATIQRASARMQLDRVWFLGDRGINDRAELLKIADVVVIPSRNEPFGLVALEAMASGTPVIGASAGGLPEIISDEWGGLFEPDNAEALALLVLRAISEHWKTWKGNAARERIRSRHDPGEWVAAFEEIYQEVRLTSPRPLAGSTAAVRKFS
jgi:glycosyltransferase involved in cell wall biosynthesis